MSLVALRTKVDDRPILGATIVGVVLAIVSVAISGLMLAGLSSFLLRSQWGPSAAANIGEPSPVLLFFIAVLYVPMLETFLGQVLPVEILRRVGGGGVACAVVSAILFGGGHYINGGLAHGLTTFCSGLVFAGGYCFSRPNGFLPAVVTASTTHAIHNFILLFVLVRIFPQWA